MRLNEIKDKKLRERIAAIDVETPQRGRDKSKPVKQDSLVGKIETPEGMVDIAGPLLIRIIRRYASHMAKRYDDDNFIAGCKPLRDAIAAALSRRGDSEKDGLWWEYQQEIGEPEIRIEIFKA